MEIKIRDSHFREMIWLFAWLVYIPLAMQGLIERCQWKQKDLHMVFIALKMAYDKVIRSNAEGPREEGSSCSLY